MRVFFATDIHGSDVCWRKFLNAGKFHKADVLIMGGDMTGKAMVPIVANGSNWELELQGQRHVLTTEDELRAMEKRISDRGYYPVRLTRDEVDAWSADSTLVDTRFKAEMLASVERWMALGDERLAGTGIRCIVSPANDDMFEIDPIIERAEHLELGEGEHDRRSTASRWCRPAGPTRRRGTRSASCPSPSFASGSTGWSPRSPTRTARSSTSTRRRTARTSTTRPKLDADMNYVAGGQALVPVGSKAVRESILAYGPPLSLHGHIHEGKGAVKLGPTLAVNPGSSYEDGVLQAAIVDLDVEERPGEALSADQRLAPGASGLLEWRMEGSMASVPDSAAPSLFLRNATGLVKGWSGFDAFSYSFMSVNLVTLGMFYSLAVFAYVPGANPILSIVLAAIAMTFLAVAYSGLIAAMPRAGGDYIWQSRILDGIPGTLTGAVVGGDRVLPGRPTPLPWATRSRSARRSVGRRRRRDHRPLEWRDRVRPGRHRLVVHPRDVGADLRRDPQHRVLPAAGGARQVGRRPDVLRLGERHPVRLDRDHRPDVRCSSRSAWPATRGSRGGACTSASSASASCSC